MSSRSASRSQARVVTSVPPVTSWVNAAGNRERVNNTRRAIASFIENGFAVTSVNAASEIAVLADVYPEITFQAAKKSNELFADRYGPSFSALFAECSRDLRCAIVNADIYLVKSAVQEALERDPSTFFVARRADILGYGGGYIGTYNRGIDALFFCPERYPALINDTSIGQLQIGAPFWDIVIPVVASFHGNVTFVKPPFILHPVHKANWSETDYRLLRATAANAVLRHARANAPISSRARRFVSMADRLVGRCATLSTRRQVKAIAALVDAWLKRIENSSSLRIKCDPMDPVLAAAISGIDAQPDLLDQLRSDWGSPDGPSPGIAGSIRMALRRRRVARRSRRWNALFLAAEKEIPDPPAEA